MVGEIGFAFPRFLLYIIGVKSIQVPCAVCDQRSIEPTLIDRVASLLDYGKLH